MKLYIQIDDTGNPINHPAIEENLVQIFGGIPSSWQPFVRVVRPKPSIYEIVDSEPVYAKVDGVWTDVWSIRPMTEEEKLAKQQAVKDEWSKRPRAENWTAWVFNEETCKYEPPIPRPEPDQAKIDQGIFTFWCGAENKWKDTPPVPQDGKQYKIDFTTWQWIPR